MAEQTTTAPQASTRMRARTWAVAAMAVVGVAAGATPASAASNAKALCIQEAARAGVLSGDINAGTVNFVGGTDGDDDLTAQLTDGVDVVCGFGGDDRVDTLSPGDIFLGGAGDDRVHLMHNVNNATFSGGEGNDTVGSLWSGTFNGGEGEDEVSRQHGGTFNGGAGNDTMNSMFGGTFNGGEGDDEVVTQYSGTFNGGAGNDTVGLLLNGTFNGGEGEDRVVYQGGGTFNQD